MKKLKLLMLIGILSINSFSMGKTNKDSENKTLMKMKQAKMQYLIKNCKIDLNNLKKEDSKKAETIDKVRYEKELKEKEKLMKEERSRLMRIVTINSFSMGKTNKDSENNSIEEAKLSLCSCCLFNIQSAEKKIIEQKKIYDLEKKISKISDCQKKISDCQHRISDCQHKISDYEHKISNEKLQENEIKDFTNCIEFLKRQEKKAKEKEKKAKETLETLKKENTMYKLYNSSHKRKEIEETDPFQQ